MNKKQHVKSVALEMVNEIGVVNITRKDLCERAEISDGSWFYVMGCTFNNFIKGLNVPTGTHTITKKRVAADLRREQLLHAAIEISLAIGYKEVTYKQIADRTGVSAALVTKYFPSVRHLKQLIMLRAIKKEVLEIIVQGLADKNILATTLPLELKRKAAESLL